MAHVLLPYELVSSVKLVPAKPRKTIWQTHYVAICLFFTLAWLGIIPEYKFSGGLNFLALMAIWALVYQLSHKKLKLLANKRNSEKEDLHRNLMKNIWKLRKENFQAALKKLPKIDYLGSLCRHSPIGRGEIALKTAMMESSLSFSQSPPGEGGAVVHQYELLELDWGKWEEISDGVRNYVADFAYINISKNIKIDIEIDGSSHDGEKESIRDERRNEIFLSRGWTVFRVRDHEVLSNPSYWANRVKELISEMENADVEKLFKKVSETNPF